MNKLSKDQLADRDARLATLEETGKALLDAVDEYNKAIEDAFDKLDPLVKAYNVAVSDALEFAQEVATDIDDYIGDKSEKWQEGERGQAYIAWRDEWDGWSLESVDISAPDAWELDMPEHGEDFGALPDEPGAR